MIRAASKMGIPTAIHESNAIPGLTTRLLEGHTGLIMVGFEECRKNVTAGTHHQIRRELLQYRPRFSGRTQQIPEGNGWA